MRGYEEKMASCKPRREPSLDTRSAGALILDSQPPVRTVGNKHLLFNPLRWRSLSRPRQGLQCLLAHTNNHAYLIQTFCQVPNSDFVFVPNFGEVNVASIVWHSCEAGAVQKWGRGPWLLSISEIPDFERWGLLGSRCHQGPTPGQQAHGSPDTFQDVQQGPLLGQTPYLRIESREAGLTFSLRCQCLEIHLGLSVHLRLILRLRFKGLHIFPPSHTSPYLIRLWPWEFSECVLRSPWREPPHFL